MPCPDVAERWPPMRPGTMQFTVTPCGANSDASARVKPTMPALPAPTWARPGAPRWLDTPPILMMRPNLFLTMCGSAAREHRNAPSRMTPMMSRHCLKVISRNGVSARLAALLIRMSTRPNFATVASTILLTAASSVTSAICTIALAPAASTSGGGLLGLLARRARVDHDRRAVAGECQRHALAEPPHTAGDDGDLAFQWTFRSQLIPPTELIPRAITDSDCTCSAQCRSARAGLCPPLYVFY